MSAWRSARSGTGTQPAAVDQGVQCPHCGTAQPAIKAGAVAAFIGKLVMLTTTGTGFEPDVASPVALGELGLLAPVVEFVKFP
jgi:hypothetical protein